MFKNYIQAQLEKLEKMDSVGLDTSALNICSQHGDISAAADELEELAAVIEEIGLENLQEQLSLDFSFDPPGSQTFQ